MSTAVHPLAQKQLPPPRRRAPARGTILLRSLILIVLALAALPVVVLPISTLVPAIVWLLLTLAELVVFVALFWFRWTRLAVGGAIGGSIFLAALAIVASQVFAATPPIRAANGQLMPNSIAVLEKVSLNGTEQWITIRGQNVNNPVLLNLGMGGPGGGGFVTRGYFEPLEEHFVVVSWDEPGTGKSYGAVTISTLTPQWFVEDAYALTQILRERFHQDKIYVYGVSWTSIVGIWLVQQHPDLFEAYVGNGQMVNTTENDVLGYQLALEFSAERGDTRSLDTLRHNGPPPYTGDGVVYKYLAFLDILNDYMHSPRYALIVPIVPMFAPEYGLVDKLNHTRGLIESFNVLYPQLRDLDFIAQAPKLDVPVYFFAGKDDVNAMASLVERYYDVLEAPHKELIWLEGGHGLSDSNLGQFVDVMVNKVLAETNR